MEQIISYHKACELTGLSRTTIWRLQQARSFPKPIELSPGRVGFLASELQRWMEELQSKALKTPSKQRGAKC